MDETFYSFFVPGLPIAQPRPRLGIRKNKAGFPGSVRVYRDVKHPVHAWKAAVRKSFGERDPLKGPIFLAAAFLLPSLAHSESQPWHTGKPDLDNLVKSTADALLPEIRNSLLGAAFHDDSQIVLCLSAKYAVAAEKSGAWICLVAPPPAFWANGTTLFPTLVDKAFPQA